MSDNSLPASNGRYKPLHILDENLTIAEVYGPMRVGEPWPLPRTAKLPQPPVKPRRRRKERKSGLYAVLHAAQQHGFTPPQAGHWLMLPPEFAAVLALEHKAIAQVVLEILQQTIGTVEYGQDGHSGRKEWATISYRHFARAGILSVSQAEIGIKLALAKGYITRRPLGAQRFEYAIRWKGTN